MQTVADILINSAKRAPHATALISEDRRFTYGALMHEAMLVGEALRRMGLAHGDTFLTVLQNHFGAAVLHWAAQLYGFTICPINWRTTATELAYFVQDGGAKAIFYDAASQEAVEEYSEIADIAVCDAAPEHWQTASWIDRAAQVELPEVSSDDVSVLLYTSGTTGRGKGVPRSHRAERAAAMAQVAQNALGFGDRALGVMPLYHTMGVRLLLATALLNGCFVCQSRFDPLQTLDLIEAHRVSSLYLVPTLYHDLMLTLERSPYDLSSVTRVGFAGASMTDGLLQKLSAAFPGISIVNHYGSSEIYTYTIDPDAAKKPGSAGRAGMNSRIALIPLGSTDVTARLSPGEEGQVIASARSDEAFAGYLNRPDADAAALRDGWYLTGDVGYMDEEGDLFLTGRVDDMIITGGENVMPIEIESALSLHASVSEAVVVGKPDARLGQKITAFIVAKANCCQADLDRFCRESGLPGYRCPKDYVFVEKIPRSPVGKVLRRLL